MLNAQATADGTCSLAEGRLRTTGGSQALQAALSTAAWDLVFAKYSAVEFDDEFKRKATISNVGDGTKAVCEMWLRNYKNQQF